MNTNTLPLDNTLICLDCEQLYLLSMLPCPCCGSLRNWLLTKWLEPQPDIKKIEEGRDE